MLRIILLLVLPIFISCSSKPKADEANGNQAQPGKEQGNEKIRVALAFINSYVNHCSNQQKQLDLADWVADNELVTEHFKTELKRIIDDANREDPESGLGFDPLFDAQDFPDAGFSAEASKAETDFIVVAGKDWPDFKLTMKVVRQNGKWLVDGCGIVNIPEEYRVLR